MSTFSPKVDYTIKEVTKYEILMLLVFRVECEVSSEIELTIIDVEDSNLTVRAKRQLRMKAAQKLADNFSDSFPSIVENFMEDFASASRKKPRYFPNAWIHRMKLHCLQSMIFCDSLTTRTLDILVEEVININNQLNVTYLIEIILTRHHQDIFDILRDEEIALRLKAPALKSIFAIAVMQMKMTISTESTLRIAELKLEILTKIILPYVMGQNYSVRSYAQAAIIAAYNHVNLTFGEQKSEIVSKVSNFCSVISESMKFKNAAKLFESLKKDFRFTSNFDDIWNIDMFYHHIPSLTKMSFEEITTTDNLGSEGIFKKIEKSQINVEIESDTEAYVISNEILIPDTNQAKTTSVNLQQKYLPYKYQIPGEKLMKTFPNQFQLNNSKNLSLVSQFNKQFKEINLKKHF